MLQHIKKVSIERAVEAAREDNAKIVENKFVKYKEKERMTKDGCGRKSLFSYLFPLVSTIMGLKNLTKKYFS